MPRSMPCSTRSASARPSAAALRTDERAAEAGHRVHDRHELAPAVGELVLDARRRLGVAAPPDEARLLERAQTLGERSRADAGKRLLQLTKTPGTPREVVDQKR